MTIDSS